MKKVAIIGFGTSKSDAPFYDDSYEIWGLNDLYESIPRWHRWFNLHSAEVVKKTDTKRAVVLSWEMYKTMPCPIYMLEAQPEIPTSIKFPLDEIQAKFCNGEKGYFTNQVSYMIAFALHENFDVIELYGIDMSIDTEYSIQRPSVEYWIGLARGMGKTVFIPPTSTLLKTLYIYGYEEEKAIAFVEMYKTKLKYLNQERDKVLADIDKNKVALNQYTGAINISELILKEYKNV